MSYEIKLAKLVTGETVIGKNEDGNIKEPAIIQTVPTQQGVQIMIVPYGYPFEPEMGGEISAEHIIYNYEKCPEELEKKYVEASSNLTIASGATLDQLDKMGGGSGSGSSGGSGIIL